MRFKSQFIMSLSCECHKCMWLNPNRCWAGCKLYTIRRDYIVAVVKIHTHAQPKMVSLLHHHHCKQTCVQLAPSCSIHHLGYLRKVFCVREEEQRLCFVAGGFNEPREASLQYIVSTNKLPISLVHILTLLYMYIFQPRRCNNSQG